MTIFAGSRPRAAPRVAQCIWHPCSRDATQHIDATNLDGRPYTVAVCDQHHKTVTKQLTRPKETA